MKLLETEIIIEAPAAKVWQVLTDFEKYPEWNPFIKEFDGEVKVGEKFKVNLHPPDSRPMTFHPRCLVLNENREFRWLGHLFIKGIFDGEHVFELEELEVGRTRFIQKEYFRGILVPLMWNKVELGTRKGFIGMNQALKNRVEQITD